MTQAAQEGELIGNALFRGDYRALVTVVTCTQQLLLQPLITGAQRLRLARVTPGVSRQCIYRGQLHSQKLPSLPSLAFSISAIYKADYSRILYVPVTRALITLHAIYGLMSNADSCDNAWKRLGSR